MKMAKASPADFDTAYRVFQILDAAGGGSFRPQTDGDEWEDLDSDNPEHLRRFFTEIMDTMESNPSGLMRVIGCASTLLADSNQVVDPDKDYLDFHPRFAEMEERLGKLLAAAKSTIRENLHLADGDCCTLHELKTAVLAAEPGWDMYADDEVQP